MKPVINLRKHLWLCSMVACMVLTFQAAGQVYISTPTRLSEIDNGSQDADNVGGQFTPIGNGDLFVLPLGGLDGGLQPMTLVVRNLVVGGQISCEANIPLTPNDFAGNLTIDASSDVVIEPGGRILAENPLAGRSGTIAIRVGGDLRLAGGMPGAFISSSKMSSPNEDAGNIRIQVNGNLVLEQGTAIAACSPANAAGNITLEANEGVFISGMIASGPSIEQEQENTYGYILSQGEASQRGGNITIRAGVSQQNTSSLEITRDALICAQGQDAGSGKIFLEGCGVTIEGTVASIARRHPGGPVTLGYPAVVLRSGKSITMKGYNLGQGGSGPKGCLRADFISGDGTLSQIAEDRHKIYLFAQEEIMIAGPANGDNFAVRCRGGLATNRTGGTIHLIALQGGVTVWGLGLQADARNPGGCGGKITVEAKQEIDLRGGSVVARGSDINGGRGGAISMRSYSSGILSDAGSTLDVSGGGSSLRGSMTLTTCTGMSSFGGFAFPDNNSLSITTGVCSPPEPTLPKNIPEEEDAAELPACSEVPLPVELLSFSAEDCSDFIQLAWATASELNNDYFAIERRESSSDWWEITRVDGKGTNSVRQDYVYDDGSVRPGISYEYRLSSVDFNGERTLYPEVARATLTGNENQLDYLLGPNYPNPFNTVTRIPYRLADGMNVRITVFDIAGGEVAKLVDGWQAAGSHMVVFDAAGLSSGIYFYHFEGIGFKMARKMILIK